MRDGAGVEGRVPDGLAAGIHATGVGSLPHRDPASALELVARYAPVVPFWPQLPSREPGEGMIALACAPFAALLEPDGPPWRFRVRPGAERDMVPALAAADPARSTAGAAGFASFLEAVAAGRFPDACALKGQLAGPTTVAGCIAPASVWTDERRAALAAHIARQAAWQARALGAWGHRVLVVVDEPGAGLDLPEVWSALAPLLAAIRAAGALVGLHCCAPLPLCFAVPRGLDALSWDASTGGAMPGPARDASVLAMPGIVPTSPPLASARGLARAFREHLAGDLPPRMLVTAGCGLGLATPEFARRVMARAAGVARRLDVWLTQTQAAAGRGSSGARQANPAW